MFSFSVCNDTDGFSSFSVLPILVKWGHHLTPRSNCCTMSSRAPFYKLSQLCSLYNCIGHLRIALVNLQQPPEQDLSWHLSYCWLSVLVWPVGCLWLSGKIALDPSAIRTTEEDLDLEDLGDLEDSKDLEEEPVRTVLDRSAIKTILERNRGKPRIVFTYCVGR